jgi:hypothetical protein
MAECIAMYHTADYSDPLVVLPNLGYVYLKSDRASMGYYILRNSTQICEMLKKMSLRESRIFCAQHAGLVFLNIDLRTGCFLAVQQYESHGKKMWAALVKLQRWFRWFPYHYAVPRRTAVAMCLHERLGEGSKLGTIGADVIELITRA